MNKDPKQNNYAALMATVVGQVGCLVVVLIGLALGAGMALDKYLEMESGIFTVLLMVGSVPVALYLTIRLSLTAVQRSQDTIQSQDSTNSEEEIDI